MKFGYKIKTIFILPSLVAGGAERVISFVSQNIDKNKFDPILIIAGFKEDTVYDTSGVEVIYLNKSRILTALPLIFSKISNYKPHIVISSISHLNTAMSMISPFFKNVKFIGREATILSERSNEKKHRKWSPLNLLPYGFKNLDALICQSQDMAEDMMINFNVPKQKIFIINNPISAIPPLKLIGTKSKVRKFITVGRLNEVKGHCRILEILSKLDYPFIYTIIGDGSMKKVILEKAKLLAINDCLNYIPFTNEVNDFIANHDMFLQGSYVEGFPNALLESCVVGTPVLAFNAPGGTKEIVIDGVNGFLVNNETEFLDKLNDKRSWDPSEIRDSVYKKFNKEKILKQYEQLFTDVLK